MGSGQKLTILDGKIAGIHDSLPDVTHEWFIRLKQGSFFLVVRLALLENF